MIFVIFMMMLIWIKGIIMEMINALSGIKEYCEEVGGTAARCGADAVGEAWDAGF